MSNTIAAMLLTTAIAWAPAQAMDVRNQIDNRPTLEIATHSFPPFTYQRSGIRLGPMVEIMEAVCLRANIKCRITLGAFKDQYERVMEGNADVLIPYLVESDKARDALFWSSPPIINTTYAFFTSSTSTWTWTGDSKELHNRTIGVYANSGTHSVAKRVAALNLSAKLVTEDTNLQALQQLVIGKYGEKSAIVINKDVAYSLLKSANIFGPRFAGDIEHGRLGLAFGRNSEKLYLAESVMNAIITLKADGTVRAILDKAETKLEASQ